MPLTRRQVHRRRRVFVGILGVLLLALIGAGIYVPVTLAAPLPSAAAVLTPPAPVRNPPVVATFPGFGRGALGAVGFDGVLASSGSQKPGPIASITKVITALVVLDAKPLAVGEQGPTITFTDADIAIYYRVLAQNGSLAPVAAGVTMSQRQVLETMLLPSANNYAQSLATWAFGSVDAFLVAARSWLDARGFTDTRLLDSNGLSDGNVSTPANLVEIGKLALANPVLSTIVATPVATEPYVGKIANTNTLLGTAGVDGIKTGTSDFAAFLLFSADFPVGSSTVTVVGVILDAKDHAVLNSAVLTLLDSVRSGFREVTLTTKGQPYASYRTVWGQQATAVSTETRVVTVWSDTPITAAAVADPVRTAPVAALVGTVTFTVGKQTVSIPLGLDRPLAEPDGWWKLSNPGELFR